MTEKDKKDQKITLTVITLSGNFTDEFNVHQKLHHVIEKTFQELHITPAPNEQWLLKYNGAVLDPQRSIEEAQLPDGATLELAPQEGGGGVLGSRGK